MVFDNDDELACRSSVNDLLGNTIHICISGIIPSNTLLIIQHKTRISFEWTFLSWIYGAVCKQNIKTNTIVGRRIGLGTHHKKGVYVVHTLKRLLLLQEYSLLLINQLFLHHTRNFEQKRNLLNVFLSQLLFN